MNPITVTLCVFVFLVVASVLAFFLLRNRKQHADNPSSSPTKKAVLLSEQEQYKMRVKFEDLPSLTEQEEAKLVEIKDNTLLARIDNAIPGTLQTLANSNAIKTSQ